MVMEKSDGKGSGKPAGHKVGVGGREYPEQIGKSCTQQKPGDASKNHASKMSWTGSKK
jgi:hypothetical protein